MKKTLFFLLVIVFVNSFSQQRCGTTERCQLLSENNKEFAIAQKKVNAETKKWIENNSNYSSKSIITIPVVVHVVWKNSVQNISDAQILSQIDVLNKDINTRIEDIIKDIEGIKADVKINSKATEYLDSRIEELKISMSNPLLN